MRDCFPTASDRPRLDRPPASAEIGRDRRRVADARRARQLRCCAIWSTAFAGDMHLINPKRAARSTGALPRTRSRQLPDGVDVAVLAIPRTRGARLGARARRARRRRRDHLLGGFCRGRRGRAGRAARDRARIASEAGMVIEGPNCLGMSIMSTASRTDLREMPKSPKRCGASGIGIVSQSGAMAAVLGVTLDVEGSRRSLSRSRPATRRRAGSRIMSTI
jgi:hypothetical protein